MTALRIPPLLAVLGCFVLGATSSGQAPPASNKEIILNVSKGQLPTDIGSDDKTKPEIVEGYKELGGGKALKVPFFAGRLSGECDR